MLIKANTSVKTVREGATLRSRFWYQREGAVMGLFATIPTRGGYPEVSENIVNESGLSPINL
jgi:hypothetical protein